MDQDLLSKYDIDPKKIPQHVAVIMDGNGRWAKEKGLSRQEGHKAGRKSAKRLVKMAIAFGVPHISIYAFSTENWRRPKLEVNFLLNFFGQVLDDEIDELDAAGVRVRFCGDLSAFNKSLQEKIRSGMERTEKNSKLTFNILTNYGSRNEIVHAVNTYLKEHPDSREIKEEHISENLYTAGSPDPDIMIRTSNEHRISNFMLWQLSYAEFFFSPVYWPDFDEAEFGKILAQYQDRSRRFGGL